jgi:hypothetical protein
MHKNGAKMQIEMQEKRPKMQIKMQINQAK